jgi:hypothetical protein
MNPVIPRELSHTEALVLVKTIGIACAGRLASKLIPIKKLDFLFKLGQITKNSKYIS